MKVRFDKLNRYEMPGFTLCNPGSTYIDGVLTRVIGAIPYTFDEEIEFNFNATSSLNFRTYWIPQDGTPEREYVANIYSKIKNRRLIFVEDIGFFIITDVRDGYEEGRMYKDVTASSCEIEIQNKTLTYVADNTYKFIDLFEEIVSTLPRWVIGYIDPDIRNKYRTFEDVDTSLNTLSFLMENMQDAYECIFVFDIIHRTINVYSQDNYIKKTDIYLSKEDIISTLEITENSDEHYTALSVFGDEDLTIAAVNPLGTTTIYNFDCYLDWMSDGLRSKVIKWAALVDSYVEPYYKMSVSYYNILARRSNCSSEIDRLNIQLDMYVRCRENIVAESNTDKVEEFNAAIKENGGKEISISSSISKMLTEIDQYITQTKSKIKTQQTTLSAIQSELKTAESNMATVHNRVRIENYFSQSEYSELYDYIYEGIYNDEYVTVTDIMTTEEQLSQMKELYNRAKRALKITAFPDQEFTVDVEDFIFSQKFQQWSDQLETGCLINVDLGDGDIAELFLTVMRLNWEDKSLSFTFGTRFNRLDPQSLFNNVLGDIQKSSNTLNYIKDIIYPVKTGKLNELENGIESSKTLAVTDTFLSSNGEVLIDSTGYTGRKKTGTSEYSPKQLKITSNTIAVTEDSWRTSDTIVGNIMVSSSVEKYGLNADMLFGKITVGTTLSIGDGQSNDLIADFKEAISALSTSTESNKASISNHSSLINSIRSTIGSIANGNTISSMLSKLQSSIDQINKNVAANSSAISALTARVEELESKK